MVYIADIEQPRRIRQCRMVRPIQADISDFCLINSLTRQRQPETLTTATTATPRRSTRTTDVSFCACASRDRRHDGPSPEWPSYWGRLAGWCRCAVQSCRRGPRTHTPHARPRMINNNDCTSPANATRDIMLSTQGSCTVHFSANIRVDNPLGPGAHEQARHLGIPFTISGLAEYVVTPLTDRDQKRHVCCRSQLPVLLQENASCDPPPAPLCLPRCSPTSTAAVAG